MGNLTGRPEKPTIAAFAGSVHTTSIFDRGVAERFRLPCAADGLTGLHKDKSCPINGYLHICNEVLFHVDMELREEGGASLSLVSFDVTDARVAPPSDVDLLRTKAFLRWLLRTHVCIAGLELREDEWVRAHSEVILEELPENNCLKKFLVHFSSGDTLQPHIATLLPRLRFLEELTLQMSRRSDVLVAAVSELLRTTTCLRSLAFEASYESGQPPKTFIDALAANSTLKTLDLWANWNAAEPPGVLGEYLRRDRLLTKLMLIGDRVDREELLLEECLVRNTNLSTLDMGSVCGGERTARFLTRILAECISLRKLILGGVRDACVNISDATMTLCAEALVKNETLEELTLPYYLWHPKNWIAFFSLLPRNRHLKRLEITQHSTEDHVRIADVLEVLARANSLPRVSFDGSLHGYVLELMHFRAFSSIELSGDKGVQLRALQRLPTVDHFTYLSIDAHTASERLFSSLANYIRCTTVLRRLSLTVTDPLLTAKTAPLSCWTLLFGSMSANTSIAHVYIHSNGNFQYNDRFAHTIGRSRNITRVIYLQNAPGNAEQFVFHLSAVIGENYNLINVGFFNVNVGIEARRSLF